MIRKIALSLLAVVGMSLAVGCSTEPKTESHREALQAMSKANVQVMEARDSGLQGVLDGSYAYIDFPDVAKGGFLVGGAWGRGIVYEKGNVIGYAAIGEASAGVLAGGQSYSELIVFKTEEAFRKFQSNRLSFGADANIVALKAGAAASAQFRDNMIVFIHNQSGLMADASIKGQNISFVPAEQVDESNWNQQQ